MGDECQDEGGVENMKYQLLGSSLKEWLSKVASNMGHATLIH